MERRISSFTINSSNSLYSGGNYPEGWGKSGRFHSSADQANSFDFDFYRLDIFFLFSDQANSFDFDFYRLDIFFRPGKFFWLWLLQTGYFSRWDSYTLWFMFHCFWTYIQIYIWQVLVQKSSKLCYMFTNFMGNFLSYHCLLSHDHLQGHDNGWSGEVWQVKAANGRSTKTVSC